MNNLLELLTLRWLRPKSQHALEQASLSPPNFDLAQGGTNTGKQEHYVFFAGNDANASLSSRSAKALKAAGITTRPTRSYDAIDGFSIPLTPEQAEALRQSPGIRSVEADRPMPFSPPVEVRPANGGSTLSPSPHQQNSAHKAQAHDPLNQAVHLEQVWVHEHNPLSRPGQSLRGLNAIELSALPIYNNGTASSGEVLPYGVKAVWGGEDVSARGNIGTGTYAFVIDSGVLNTTGDLNINTTWSKSWISGESAFTDGNGHGTHVAGTIAALANGKGVVGVAPGAEVISLKVFDSSGGGATYNTIIDAINHATQVINNNGLDKSKVVINMSLGGGYSAGLDQAVKNAANQGIKFAIAAGNSGDDADYYSPASAGDHDNVYTVSAVDNVYQMPWWSNWDDQSGGDDVDVAAPGVGVYSHHQGGQLAYLSGTSMAAPHVAGLLLMGGVTNGEMVKAASRGQSDPLALIKNNEELPQPEQPDENNISYTYSYHGAAYKNKSITISNGITSINQAELENKLGLAPGSLDSTLNGTKQAINATEGSAITITGNASAGQSIEFKYSFSSNDSPPYEDYAFYAINGRAYSLATLSEQATNKSFSHTLKDSDFAMGKIGTFELSIGVMDAIDLSVDSFIDINNFKITSNFFTIETSGFIDLLTGAANLAYAKDSLGNSSQILWRGTHIGNDTWKAWSVVGAENINGNNTVAIQHSDGQLEFLSSTSNSSWNTTKWSNASVGSLAFFQAESNFKQDFNADGTIGQSFTTKESAGDIDLLTGAANLAFAKDSLGNSSQILWRGTHIGNDTWEAWSVVGAENINGNNTVAIQHSDGQLEFLSSTSNSSWNTTKWSNASVGSLAFFQAESNFNQDFNNDSIIGFS